MTTEGPGSRAGRLRRIGELAVLLPLWRKLIPDSGDGKIGMAIVTPFQYLITVAIIASAACGGNKSSLSTSNVLSATPTVLPTTTHGPNEAHSSTPSATGQPATVQPATGQPTAPELATPQVTTQQITTPVPLQPARSFDDGTFVVGTDIVSGTYRTPGDPYSCYWERLSGFGGTDGEIIAYNSKPGGQVVTIAANDAGFHTSACGTWTQDLSATTSSPDAPFSDGTFIVGVDISAGIWRSDGSDDCYWERLSGFGGTLVDTIANNVGIGSQVVTIAASDAGFRSDGCGNWIKAG